MYYNRRSAGNITKINEIHDNQAMKTVQSSCFWELVAYESEG